jgi:hypothetical protein
MFTTAEEYRLTIGSGRKVSTAQNPFSLKGRSVLFGDSTPIPVVETFLLEPNLFRSLK